MKLFFDVFRLFFNPFRLFTLVSFSLSFSHLLGVNRPLDFVYTDVEMKATSLPGKFFLHSSCTELSGKKNINTYRIQRTASKSMKKIAFASAFLQCNGVSTLVGTEARKGTGNKWFVWNCVEAFIVHRNQDEERDLLSSLFLPGSLFLFRSRFRSV